MNEKDLLKKLDTIRRKKDIIKKSVWELVNQVHDLEIDFHILLDDLKSKEK